MSLTGGNIVSLSLLSVIQLFVMAWIVLVCWKKLQWFVEGKIRRVCVQNESSGFASLAYYGLVVLAKAVEISYIESIIPLVGATFSAADEISANEKIAEIIMFSFEQNNYYQFGAYNFDSCAVCSTTYKELQRGLLLPSIPRTQRLILLSLVSLSLTVTAKERIHRMSFPELRTAKLLSTKNGMKICLDIIRQSLVRKVQPQQLSHVPVRPMRRNLLPTACRNQYPE